MVRRNPLKTWVRLLAHAIGFVSPLIQHEQPDAGALVLPIGHSVRGHGYGVVEGAHLISLTDMPSGDRPQAAPIRAP